MCAMSHIRYFTEASFTEMCSSSIQAKSRVRNWTGCVPVPHPPQKRLGRGEKLGEDGVGRGRVRMVDKNDPGPRGVRAGLCGHTPGCSADGEEVSPPVACV